MAQKEYEYEEVLDYLNTNGTLDQAYQNFQQAILELEKAGNELQEFFHGEKRYEIYQKYDTIYRWIGTVGGGTSGTGLWKAAKNLGDLNNILYSRAKADQEIDQGSV